MRRGSLGQALVPVASVNVAFWKCMPRSGAPLDPFTRQNQVNHLLTLHPGPPRAPPRRAAHSRRSHWVSSGQLGQLGHLGPPPNSGPLPQWRSAPLLGVAPRDVSVSSRDLSRDTSRDLSLASSTHSGRPLLPGSDPVLPHSSLDQPTPRDPHVPPGHLSHPGPQDTKDSTVSRTPRLPKDSLISRTPRVSQNPSFGRTSRVLPQDSTVCLSSRLPQNPLSGPPGYPRTPLSVPPGYHSHSAFSFPPIHHHHLSVGKIILVLPPLPPCRTQSGMSCEGRGGGRGRQCLLVT
ncbi:hypothetical protein Pmani_005449 [Petrolisthes manimaculis]|uniref:Uncharacterized protein n=1 Tax=Petrolisthes manimaculis TaxID=1843537 RepID=A0AAE1UGN1_9EUCA|nr:hypothetical protein Pmani_005449 [Petrolisthes manimaculis]